MTNARMMYFIRVTNVGIFNAIVKSAESAADRHRTKFSTRRQGYYELLTPSEALWQELYLYGQMLAQAQDEQIDGGHSPTR